MEFELPKKGERYNLSYGGDSYYKVGKSCQKGVRIQPNTLHVDFLMYK